MPDGTNFKAKHALALVHEKQINILLDENLTDEQKVREFAAVAEFDAESRHGAERCRKAGYSAACAVWCFWPYPKSLFGALPGCRCPVEENANGANRFPDIPSKIPHDWKPTRETLEAFARVQQEHR